MEATLYDLFYQQERTHWWFQAREQIISELIGHYVQPSPPLKILDIGCGTGMIMQSLGQFGEVFGIDKDEKAIEYCHQRGIGNLFRANFPEGPVPPMQFDLITLLDVIEHISDDALALKRASGLLKPGGYIVVTVPAFKLLWSPHDIANHHLRRYTKRQLRGKLEEANLLILKLSYFNFFLLAPTLAKKVVDNLRYKNSPRSHLEDKISPFMNRLYTAIFSAEKYLLKEGSFPVGVSLIALARRQ